MYQEAEAEEEAVILGDEPKMKVKEGPIRVYHDKKESFLKAKVLIKLPIHVEKTIKGISKQSMEDCLDNLDLTELGEILLEHLKNSNFAKIK